MKQDKLYHALSYILDSIDKIEAQTSSGFEEFQNNETLFTSTLFYLEKLADATQHIHEDVKSVYKHIEWRKIKGFRNVIAHEYLEGYDIQMVWDTIKQKLPPLKQVILEIKKFKYNE